MPKIEETTFKHLADKILRAKVGFRIINDEINRKEQNSNQPTTSTNLDSLIAINENDLKEISTFLEYDEEMSNSPIDNIIPTTNQQCVRPIFCKERISKKMSLKMDALIATQRVYIKMLVFYRIESSILSNRM